MRRILLTVLAPTVVTLAAFFVWSERAGDPDLAQLATDGDVSVGSGTDGAADGAPEPMVEPTAEPTPAPTPTPTPEPTPPPLGSVSCDTGGSDAPTGTVSIVPGSGATAGTGPVRTFTIEVEDGLAIDGGCFADEVERILFDERSWVGTGEVTWQRVDADPDTRIILASPSTTDQLCLPFQTNGIFSCTIEQSRTVLNADRWREGADDFLGIDEYRIYLVNHEIGHVLRHDHIGCPGEGLPAPVMMQQTKDVGACVPNPWPLRDTTEG